METKQYYLSTLLRKKYFLSHTHTLKTRFSPTHTYCASLIDATAEIPDATRLLGFFVPIFHSAILIDANAEKRRVDGI